MFILIRRAVFWEHGKNRSAVSSEFNVDGPATAIARPAYVTRRCDQGLIKLWNFEARACIGLQKNLDFINKNVRLD